VYRVDRSNKIIRELSVTPNRDGSTEEDDMVPMLKLLFLCHRLKGQNSYNVCSCQLFTAWPNMCRQRHVTKRVRDPPLFTNIG